MSSELASLTALERHWRLIARLLREEPSERGVGASSGSGVLESLEDWQERDTQAPAITNLPLLAYTAADGGGRRAMPIMAAWQATHLGLKLLDDAEDGDAGKHLGEIINTGTALLAVASIALEELPMSGVSPEIAESVRLGFYRAVLRACVGQQSDLTARRGRVSELDPEGWLEIAGAKSGGLLAWAAWAGALAAGASERSASCYHDFGYRLGILLQVADDFGDVWGAEESSDLALGSPGLPACYALHVTRGEERDQMERLLERAADGDGTAEGEARQRLTDLGAQGYLLVVAQVQYQQALAALHSAGGIPSAIDRLQQLLDRVMPALKLAA